MIIWFKNRQKAIIQARQDGVATGRKQIKQYYENKLQTIKQEVRKVLKKKNDEIQWRDNYIDEIKKTIENYMYVLTEAQHIMQLIEQNKNLEILELVKKQQEVQCTIDKVVSITRRSKKFNRVQAQIEQYNVRKLNYN
jgi:galactitol-specific phosphotransferase system IIB component